MNKVESTTTTVEEFEYDDHGRVTKKTTTSTTERNENDQ